MTPEELGILREMAAEERAQEASAHEISIMQYHRARASSIESALREIEKLREICRDRGAMLDEYGDRERRGR